MKRSFVTTIAMATLCAGVLAQSSPAVPAFQSVHQADRIRVFYHTEGQHAVDTADANANGVPDQVEDVLTQTRAAHMMFVDVLGFPDPFSTERFRSASFLDIHLRHKDVLKMNGVAFDELQRFKRAGDPEGTLSLCFNVATSVKSTGNLTPAHEYFHIIQNSVTYFKNRWYTEGTARWSERALGTGALGPAQILSSWPLSQDKATAIFGMAYDAAEHFWNPLCAKVDAKGQIPAVPDLQRLQAMTYTDGTPVLKDLQLTGWQFMRDVLAGLEQADDVALRELGYEKWSEENQRSSKNDAYILRAVEEAVKARQ